jgi:hypothetical protein
MSMQVMQTLNEREAEREERKVLIQRIMLDLIGLSTYNSFDGKKVRADLESIRSRWEACLMTRDGDCGITLRDLSSGCYNVDTLYILTCKANVASVMKLAKTWKADHITKITNEGQFGADRWESKDCESYEFHKLGKLQKQDVASFICASPSEKQVVLRLWWD